MFLFTVRTTREALLDSKFLVLSADIAAQQVQRLKTAVGAFDVDLLLTRLISFLSTPTIFNESIPPADTEHHHIGPSVAETGDGGAALSS